MELEREAKKWHELAEAARRAAVDSEEAATRIRQAFEAQSIAFLEHFDAIARLIASLPKEQA